MRSRISRFIIAIQSILFLVHLFLYETWAAFFHAGASHAGDPPGFPAAQAIFAFLSVSFITASLLAWRYSNFAVRVYYTFSAIWLGAVNFCFFAACACWIVYGIAKLTPFHVEQKELATGFLGLAVLASAYAIVNAGWTRVSRVTVTLPGVPAAWRGRVAALVSDTHLGHVRNYGFIRRIVRMVSRLHPDIVFITGDLYDGTAANVARLAEPLSDLRVPFGAYFITGNHEEFRDRDKYIAAVARSGVRVLNNEKVEIDGLQVVGVHHREQIHPRQLQCILQQADLDRNRASILLLHPPSRLDVAEKVGISLQLSGHTHGGQFIPWTWIASRVWGTYIHGLHRHGKMQVFTTWGAGTWGPPMRLGTRPEIVLIQFE